jgi:hypothetical protein
MIRKRSSKAGCACPRAWYFLHFAALASSPSPFWSCTRIRWLRSPGYVLALFGQTSLVLFTGHMFVLPTLELIKQFTQLHGAMKVIVAFVPFVVFCGLVMYGRHRRLKSESAERTAKIEQPSPVAVG